MTGILGREDAPLGAALAAPAHRDATTSRGSPGPRWLLLGRPEPQDGQRCPKGDPTEEAEPGAPRRVESGKGVVEDPGDLDAGDVEGQEAIDVVGVHSEGSA